jgi:hypothetical protein
MRKPKKNLEPMAVDEPTIVGEYISLSRVCGLHDNKKHFRRILSKEIPEKNKHECSEK